MKPPGIFLGKLYTKVPRCRIFLGSSSVADTITPPRPPRASTASSLASLPHPRCTTTTVSSILGFAEEWRTTAAGDVNIAGRRVVAQRYFLLM